MYYTSSGNLELYGAETGNDDKYIRIGSSYSQLGLYASNTMYFNTSSTGGYVFGQDAVEKVRITSSGDVGIGSTIPSQKLDVNGTIKSYSGTNAATFKDNQLRSDSSGTFYFDHGTVGQSFQFRTSTSSSLDTTGPSITSAGNIAFASGKGIDFSATSNSSGTMSSELLSDYEEGTWTPGVVDSGSSNLYSSGTRYGFYTKIGDTVFDNATITSGTAVRISNFPFTCTSSTSRYPGFNSHTTGAGWNSLSIMGGYMRNNETQFQIIQRDSFNTVNTVNGVIYMFLTVIYKAQ
jgi:hypothetical protein